MIHLTSGDLLNTEADALVNTVNTVGVMGKGIALQFRQAFPDNYKIYRKACVNNEVLPGRMLVVETHLLVPRFIINFPTKRHWQSRSRIEDIEIGLSDLVIKVRLHGIQTIAIPPLGCGNGGLDWNDVRPLIENAFIDYPDVDVLLFSPDGAPQVNTMRVATKRPNMTAGRAAIIGLLQRYTLTGAKLTMLEVQKLAYFLQSFGEPLQLDFTRHLYGPYTEKLHFVLQRMEGHFTRGYGDRSQYAAISVIPEIGIEAEDFLRNYPDTLARYKKVLELVKNWANPKGLELLATVHWIIQEYPELANNSIDVVKMVHGWNEHKKIFPPKGIEKALQDLHYHALVPQPQSDSHTVMF